MNSAKTSKDTEFIILAVPTQKSQAWDFTCVLPNLEKIANLPQGPWGLFPDQLRGGCATLMHMQGAAAWTAPWGVQREGPDPDPWACRAFCAMVCGNQATGMAATTGSQRPSQAYLLSSSDGQGLAARGAGTRLCSAQRPQLRWSRPAEET